jgi:hypothetical protein
VKRIIISEEEKKHIKGLYKINEQGKSPLDIIFSTALDKLEKFRRGEIDPEDMTTSDSTSDSSEYDSSSVSSFEPGEFFVHPNAESIKINYGTNAIKLNPPAELLLKSIFAQANTPNLKVTSTLRTYDDQARVNKQNSRTNIINWYCKGNPNCELVKKWDLFKSNQITQQEYSDYLKKNDSSSGKIISNHIPGFAIDVTPFSEKFAATAEKLKNNPNSGIRKVLREKSNNAVHIEFNFPVTDKGGTGKIPKMPTKKEEKRFDKQMSKGGIIVDKNNNTSNYAIVFGGWPSDTYGAQFMFNKGSKILSDKNVIYSNFENSLDSVLNQIKSEDPKAKITSVSGFSAGGKNAWEAATKGYKVGLIDPVVPDFATQFVGSEFSGKLPSNIKMISRQENWSGKFRKHGERLKNLELTQPNVRRNVSHDDMPSQFFSEFKNFV